MTVADFNFLPHPMMVSPHFHFFPIAIVPTVMPSMVVVPAVASTNCNVYTSIGCACEGRHAKSHCGDGGESNHRFTDHI